MLRQFHSNFCLFLCLFCVCVCLIPRTHPSVAAHTARKTTETFDNCREQQQQKKIKHKKAIVIEIRKKKRSSIKNNIKKRLKILKEEIQ